MHSKQNPWRSSGMPCGSILMRLPWDISPGVHTGLDDTILQQAMYIASNGAVEISGLIAVVVI